QDVFLSGVHSKTDAETLPENKRFTNTRSRLFVYRDGGADGVHDRFGVTVEPANGEGVGLREVAACRNGLYLLLLFGDGTLATLDPDCWRFMDAVRVPNRMATFDMDRRGAQLLRTPDGGRMICMYDAMRPPKDAPEPADPPKIAAATFAWVETGVDGRIAIRAHLKCSLNDPASFVGPAAFVYDARNNGGSYDLVVGPNWRKPEGAVKIVRDFLPARP
ncbi:MAG: hypothetical protein GX591_02300, partial [Planctomycetes bacterium]|nr:hypothetical protein [Planctomycetota bacterium]